MDLLMCVKVFELCHKCNIILLIIFGHTQHCQLKSKSYFHIYMTKVTGIQGQVTQLLKSIFLVRHSDYLHVIYLYIVHISEVARFFLNIPS